MFISNNSLGLTPWSRGWFLLPVQGAGVRSLVRELRSHMPQNVVKIFKKLIVLQCYFQLSIQNIFEQYNFIETISTNFLYSVLLILIGLFHIVNASLFMPNLTTSWSGHLENTEYWVMQISKMVWCILLYNIKSTFTHIATSLIKKFSTIQKLSSPSGKLIVHFSGKYLQIANTNDDSLSINYSFKLKWSSMEKVVSWAYNTNSCTRVFQHLTKYFIYVFSFIILSLTKTWTQRLIFNNIKIKNR